VLGGLQQSGKIAAIGLATAKTSAILNIHSRHGVGALQSSYSLLHRTAEHSVFSLAKRLGAAFIAARPPYIADRGCDNPAVKMQCAFSGISHLAEQHRLPPLQLALAWLYHQSVQLVALEPLSGFIELEMAINAMKLSLTESEVLTIERAANGVQS
jgi:aryl-alcohol dehydrogenase-like predicted oxidoreductase